MCNDLQGDAIRGPQKMRGKNMINQRTNSILRNDLHVSVESPLKFQVKILFLDCDCALISLIIWQLRSLATPAENCETKRSRQEIFGAVPIQQRRNDVGCWQCWLVQRPYDGFVS